ncbi:UDP-N-acetylmuramoyl-tripeptide--D-alanyl-D-alanine ligase [Halopseudomonas xinjiangensis]|uniref:UDP-N-acetylmuramoyl-tripeptide--D-alanyl-D-alanine ligase n=1 Tax=Halopseudomonas xinjiangensis TaxID=487184 RepID=A0A1H1LPJ4_9GAMM|nr:UDP-N-acetylmuramoyl-tripeptide--D-alanyl-D-alanine ligase [Halopseudomonas xinjiangensis]SDR76481.1 UDP-N-acetylmuramoyl-tripeptide--D-alanyl-D-alanine ligase [Halopseudomonas xinjiangensis]
MLEAKRLSDMVKALSASLHGDDARFDHVCIDSREARTGSLFVALQGSRVNGHDFVGKARERGAVAALVEYLVDDPLPQLLVHDAQLALGQLGALARDDFSGPLVAITGSSGKTSVKEMLAAILREEGPVLATRGNLNNELGVPLTLLELSVEHKFAVIEMGAAGIGDIAYSMRLARPHVSVLTNAGTAHVGRFGGPEQVARAKSEIYTGLDADGQAVINLDSPWFEQWYQLLGKRKSFAFSLQNPTAELRAESVELDRRGCPGFALVTPKGSITVQLNLLGKHNIANALAAAGAALALDVDLEMIRRGLAKVMPVPGRAQSLPGKDGALIIDDSYNANPGSVKAAIDLLAAFEGKRILVLGDMGELGQWEEESHREVGDYASEQGLDGLYAVGRLSALAVESFGEGARLFASKAELTAALLDQLSSDVRVLVKGSRSAGMEQVVAGLTEHNDNHNDDKAH